MGAEAPVVAGDDDAAAARGLRVVDAVFDAEAGGGAGGAELLGVFVLADAADVEDGVGGEDVLGAAGGVLGGAAGDEGVLAGEEVVVEGHVGFFGQDGVVGFEGVFLEHGIIALGVGRVMLEGDRLDRWD